MWIVTCDGEIALAKVVGEERRISNRENQAVELEDQDEPMEKIHNRQMNIACENHPLLLVNPKPPLEALAAY